MVASYSDIEHHCGVTFTNLPLQVRPPGAKQIYRYIYISLISNGGDDEPVAHHSPKKSLPLLAFDEADNDARAGPDTLRHKFTGIKEPAGPHSKP